jgi:hypothetical protein
MKRTLMRTGLAAVLTTVFMAMPSQAKDKSMARYKATVMVQGANTRPTTLELQIYRWSTDTERGKIVAAIMESTADVGKNDRNVAKALRDQAKTGFYFMGGGQGYPLRYANSIEMGGGKRQIILATDRPVSPDEVFQTVPFGSRDFLGDFDVTLIVLNLDETGKGEGLFSLGTEMKWNDQEGKIDLTDYSTQAIRLGDVRPAK